MEIPTRRIRYIDGGHEGRINVEDFDPKLHEAIDAEPALPAEADEAPPTPDFQSLSAVEAIEFIRKTEWSHDGIITAMAVERKRDKPRKTVLAEASRVADQLAADEEE